ncbi:MAG: exodeoxyribonuclease VII small subunit [Alphaproteobacteria bacterium]|nr:exodeoxyribonuclease VII small subunit [Alphaproteobacteria bacterium]MBR7158477.1 exodeoxyribonuclease VII small subunit [Alphaproteobacteria bacterium]
MDEVKPQDIEKMTFEEAMAELENIVRQLEGGKVKLEDAVNAYSRGMALRDKCEEKLNEAKLKIDQITVAAEGKPAGITPVTIE